jgi:hypothetical protein
MPGSYRSYYELMITKKQAKREKFLADMKLW